MTNGTAMEVKHQYTVEEVIEIVNSLSAEDKEKVRTIISTKDKTFEDFVKEDFVKYEATFKALA